MIVDGKKSPNLGKKETHTSCFYCTLSSYTNDQYCLLVTVYVLSWIYTALYIYFLFLAVRRDPILRFFLWYEDAGVTGFTV
jgi:hypothetical protein